MLIRRRVGLFGLLGKVYSSWHSYGDNCAHEVEYLSCLMHLLQRDQTSNWNIKEHFPQYEDVLTSRAINVSTKLRLLKCTCGPLYCTDHPDVKVGPLVREWNRNWKLQKCGFYGVCCILHGLTKCQMKKYFKEPIHQEISWRLLLTGKCDLWDTSWERVSWKRSRWPAKELEVDKGKRLWTGCHSLVGDNGRSMTYNENLSRW